MSSPLPTYDRELLLHGPKRNEILQLWEIERYGVDSYGDADYVCVYGLRPAEWYGKGIRMLGRTAVECTRDALGDAIGRDVAAVAAEAPRPLAPLILDAFAGSANTLYWLLHHLPGSEGIAFELDEGVFRLTAQNLAMLSLPIRMLNADYRSGLANVSLEKDRLLIAFVAPPWGKAFDAIKGLDLRRTSPPIAEIVDELFRSFASNPLLLAVQTYEVVDAESLAEIRVLFDWSSLHLYTLNAPGRNHGIFLGSKGWAPSRSAG